MMNDIKNISELETYNCHMSVTPKPGKIVLSSAANLHKYISFLNVLFVKAGSLSIRNIYLKYWRNSPIKDIMSPNGPKRPFLIMHLIGNNHHILSWKP